MIPRFKWEELQSAEIAYISQDALVRSAISVSCHSRNGRIIAETFHINYLFHGLHVQLIIYDLIYDISGSNCADNVIKFKEWLVEKVIMKVYR